MSDILGIDYQGQPLLDAWWTRGWTSQNDSYIQAPSNLFTPPGFPAGLTFVTVTANYFDENADPISGYFTFWPSDDLTITSGSTTTIMPRRRVGYNQTLLGLNQFGSGKIFLWHGQLLVQLLATDNTGANPATFTYHVEEHFLGGKEYDISVPKATSSPADIHSLIVPSSPQDRYHFFRLAAVSTEFISADISALTGGMPFNPTSFPVNFAFISGAAEPGNSDWHSGTWATTSAPYMAQILVGPAGGLSLATGTYKIWIQVVTNSQVPVIEAGTLKVY